MVKYENVLLTTLSHKSMVRSGIRIGKVYFGEIGQPDLSAIKHPAKRAARCKYVKLPHAAVTTITGLVSVRNAETGENCVRIIGTVELSESAAAVRVGPPVMLLRSMRLGNTIEDILAFDVSGMQTLNNKCIDALSDIRHLHGNLFESRYEQIRDDILSVTELKCV